MDSNFDRLIGLVEASLDSVWDAYVTVLLCAGVALCAIVVVAGLAYLWRAISRRRNGNPDDPQERTQRTRFLQRLANSADEKGLRHKPGTFGLTGSGEFVDARAARSYRAFRSRSEPAQPHTDDDFFTTVWATYWFHSPLLGYAFGRSASGALVGATLLSDRSSASSSSSSHSPSNPATPAEDSQHSTQPECATATGGSTWFGGGASAACTSSWFDSASSTSSGSDWSGSSSSSSSDD